MFAILHDNKLLVSWVGDSQVMMVRNGEPVCLMEPHKPERQVKLEEGNKIYFYDLDNKL